MGNPCTEFPGYRAFVIAALPRLMKLDGKEVSVTERIEARRGVAQLTQELRNAAATRRAERAKHASEAASDQARLGELAQTKAAADAAIAAADAAAAAAAAAAASAVAATAEASVVKGSQRSEGKSEAATTLMSTSSGLQIEVIEDEPTTQSSSSAAAAAAAGDEHKRAEVADAGEEDEEAEDGDVDPAVRAARAAKAHAEAEEAELTRRVSERQWKYSPEYRLKTYQDEVELERQRCVRPPLSRPALSCLPPRHPSHNHCRDHVLRLLSRHLPPSPHPHPPPSSPAARRRRTRPASSRLRRT